MDALLPFDIPMAQPGDKDYQGELSAALQLAQRIDEIERLLRTGGKHPDILLDMLAEQSIEPSDYVETVEHNIELVIAQCLPLTDCEWYVPP